MKFVAKKIRMSWGGLVLLALAAAPAPAQKLESADTALLRLDRPAGATIGVRLETGIREFKYADTVLDTDLMHVLGRVGGNLAPFLTGWGEAGWVRAKADEPDLSGSGGLEWAAGLDAKLLEFVLNRSPVVDRKEALALGLGASYRRLESNFDTADFAWSEIRAGPTLSYIRNYAGEPRRSYQPVAVAARLGLVYLNADGDFGEEGISENRDFALTLGFDLQGESGWVTRFGVTLFGIDEREFTLGTSYNF